MTIHNSKVKALIEEYKKIVLLSQINSVLEWDMNVNLPAKGAEVRASQTASMTDLIAQKWLNKKFLKLLDQAKSEKDLNLEERAVLRNLEYEGKIYFKVPKDLIVEKSRTTSESFMIWQKAKLENNFSDFLPYLQKVIELDQLIASHLGNSANPYDSLLDLFEPGLTTKFLGSVFTPLQKSLTQTLTKIQKSKNYRESDELIGGNNVYKIDQQRQLATYILKKMNYDFEAGRMDSSSHPFETTLGRQDVRITTWYKEYDFRESFAAAMHEGGHALYEQGINLDFADTPLDHGVSYAIHESQSRFWENMVGRNPKFISFMLPIFQAFYPEQLGKAGEERLVKIMNLVKPSLIRVQADEVTYNLHIILRFELEKLLINGKLRAKDLPDAWMELMKKYLKIIPETDREGVLQDIHWSIGAFGYFPTYALGNLYSAQITQALKKELNLDDLVRGGELGTILSWLRSNIHHWGKLYWPKELITKVSGEELNPRYFIDYINSKYQKIYQF